MCEQIVELIRLWKLSPFAVAGWLIAGMLLVLLRTMWSSRESSAKEIREWLREDSQAKQEAVAAYAKVATSLVSLEKSLEALERTVMITRHRE